MIYLMQLKPKYGQQLTLAKISANLISIIETINQAVVIFDDNNNCLFFNAVAEQILGDRDNIPLLVDWAKSLDGRLSKQIEALPPNDLCLAIASLGDLEVNDVEIFLSQVDMSDDLRVRFNQKMNSLKAQDLSSESMMALAAFDDRLTEEESLNYILYDKLTQLPNQELLLQLIQESILTAYKSQDYIFAVLLIDIDLFEGVGNSLGKMLSERILVAIADKLRNCLRSQDLIARLDGDKFAVLLQNIQSEKDVPIIAERIYKELKLPLDISGYDIFIDANIGIAIGTSDYTQPEELLRDAELAMSNVKKHSRTHYQVFTETMYADTIDLLQIENDLYGAIERQELQLHYQPITSLVAKKIIG